MYTYMCMYIYIYIYIYIYMCEYMHIHLYMFMVCIHTNTHMYINVYTYIYGYMFTYLFMLSAVFVQYKMRSSLRYMVRWGSNTLYLFPSHSTWKQVDWHTALFIECKAVLIHSTDSNTIHIESYTNRRGASRLPYGFFNRV